MAIAEWGIDVFEELAGEEIAVLSGTLVELERIGSSEKGKEQRSARLGLAIVRSKGVRVVASSGHVDDELVRLSKEGWMVLTQDKALKKRLSGRVLVIRQKKRIVEG